MEPLKQSFRLQMPGMTYSKLQAFSLPGCLIAIVTSS